MIGESGRGRGRWARAGTGIDRAAADPSVGGRRANRPPPATGGSVELLVRFGRRYAVIVRAVVLMPICAIAVLQAPAERQHVTGMAVAALTAWTCGYGWWLARTDRPVRPLAVDVAVLLAACTGILVVDTAADAERGPLRLLITFAAVTYQWYAPVLAGGVAALATIGGLLATSAMVGADATALRGQAWALVAATLSRVMWTLVLRAAARADTLADEAARVRREAQVEAAVRADQRELATTLHDTAATTLLMVGSGQVPAGADWLVPQARRDLERLHANGRHPVDQADLVALLRADLAARPLDVRFEGPAGLPLPSAVAWAIVDATGEALTNVRRHAGVDRALVRLRTDAGQVRLDVVDEGKGFVVDDVPPVRRGLRHSVRGRLIRVGGRATVHSTVGTGTVVRLEWSASDTA